MHDGVYTGIPGRGSRKVFFATAIAVSITLAVFSSQPAAGPTKVGWPPLPRERIVQIDVHAVEALLRGGSLVVLPFFQGPRTLDLEWVDIYAPGAMLHDEGADVSYPLESGSYVGTFWSVDGTSGSVSLTIHPPFLDAFLWSGNLVEWVRTESTLGAVAGYYAGEVEVPSGPAFTAVKPKLVSREGRDVGTQGHGTFTCGTTPPDLEDMVPHADYDFYRSKNSNLVNVRDYIEADINRVTNDVYHPQVCIRFRILGIEVHTTLPDDLSSTDCGLLLSQLNSHFIVVHDPSYYFDVGHLFTMKNLPGSTFGCALNETFRQSLSQHYPEAPLQPWNSWHRLYLESHEIAHNYNAKHAFWAVHCIGTSVCYQTIMAPVMFTSYGLLNDFSDINSARITGWSPKPNQ